MPADHQPNRDRRALPALVAHRGASADARENTLDAFLLAWEQGADAIEGDFHLTRDGQVVCHHDPVATQHSGKPIPIRELALTELRSLPGCDSVPLLRDVMETIPRNKSIFIEVKCGPEIIDPLLQDIRLAGPGADQVTIISFNQDVVAGIKNQSPETIAYWLVDFKGSKLRLQPDTQVIIRTAAALNCDGVGLKADPRLSLARISLIQSAGYRVNVWTVDSVYLALHFARIRVDSITTNKPRYIRSYLNKHFNTC